MGGKGKKANKGEKQIVDESNVVKKVDSTKE